MRAHLLVVLVLFSYFARGAFVETVYTATLSTNQEVPLPLDPPQSAGTGVCVLTRHSNPPILDCEIQHNVIQATAAHLHLAPRGVAGRVAFSFSGSIATHFRQAFKLIDMEDYPVSAQINDFLSGLFYINIHSDDYPSGEIRGQLEQTDRFYARLSSSNTIPHASGTSAHGIVVGTYSTQNRELAFDIVHSVQQPLTSGLEIRQGAAGIVGPLVYSFKNAQSPSFQTVQYTINEESDFFKDLHYINVLSNRNPTGEIRGQIVTIDYIDELSFTVRMDADQVIPGPVESNNRGVGLFAYHCDTKILEYVLMHNVPDALGAFIGAAPLGEPGITLFSLTTGASPIYGALQLRQEEELLLYSRSLYVSVVSDEFSQGEIRGQITVDFDWWAYLSGSNVVSPVTTPSVGIATMTLFGQQNRKLDYSIFHSVQTPLRATLNVAREGENGPLDLVFPSAFSPIRGDDIVFDDDELEAFVTEGSYVSITSLNYPFLGEIRGQVRRVNPCKAQNDNSLTVSVSFDVGKEWDEEKENENEIPSFANNIDEIDNSSTTSLLPADEIGDQNTNIYFEPDTAGVSSLSWGFGLCLCCFFLLVNYL
mmetsp:Transcript_127592/g.190188  ORF Transcript_127592/g.190188 Transcript_127592/m.190188 type:complete len:593 (-) Transcript_127592:76-1854(-)